jgi:hypothetical protein
MGNLFKRGDIPREYWDAKITPNEVQLGIINDLIETKQFSDTEYRIALATIEHLGDTRWIDADQLIDQLVHLPNRED